MSRIDFRIRPTEFDYHYLTSFINMVNRYHLCDARSLCWKMDGGIGLRKVPLILKPRSMGPSTMSAVSAQRVIS